MLPLRDNIPSATRPTLTWLLIAANVVAFLWELSGADVLPLTLVPARFISDPAGNAATILTAMFLHGGWLHLLGNMLYLWIFGDNVEDRLGHGGFLIFYLLVGVVSVLTHAFVNRASTLPLIGASGAIAGVLGAYLVLFPRARIRSLAFIGFFFTTVAIPAIVFLPLWFLMQFFFGLGSIGTGGGGVGL